MGEDTKDPQQEAGSREECLEDNLGPVAPPEGLFGSCFWRIVGLGLKVLHPDKESLLWGSGKPSLGLSAPNRHNSGETGIVFCSPAK